MIVKDEAPTLAQTLASVRGTLGDNIGHVIVHDTGSTDNTVEVATKAGALVSGPWPFIDFSSARNACLEHAFDASRGAPVMMIDAGMILRGSLKRMSADLPGTVQFKLGEITYPKQMIFTPGWRFVGRVHEYSTGPNLEDALESGLVYDYCLKDDGARQRRHARDLEILRDPQNEREQFYLAQTLHCLGRNAEAYEEYIKRGEQTGGFWQERVMAYIRAIDIAPTDADAEACARKALALDKYRAEAWIGLCWRAWSAMNWELLGMRAQLAIACEVRRDTSRVLFHDTSTPWRARDYLALSVYRRGDKGKAQIVWEAALHHNPPEADAARIRANILTC